LIGFVNGEFGNQKTDNRLVFQFRSGKKMEVKLIDCDLEIANQFFKEVQSKIHLSFKIQNS
jgi:hypothetical protein